ncbi:MULTISPECIES: hypothetical protein [Streptomyces]|uniref:Integral membrane protein n=1 Tax=Streptomyces caniscabiei TaxID=2746961 RepID=A0ABU4N4Z2_9ACTN|nr:MULTISPECIES: hypothetical protein [Streptomyces]MBE4741838.1 hypothetical protein [Streptomyces caniscabiei]MBE4762492.1 hypothetical protein [Streptomyces caniscabiei]MBE4775745.1 hypothetical protein [Streptomyces caniscabiei]MBE4790583.1 hypothetical protein [Streptomyces caniscabiei]MBE4799792.1 hypothetical protein [Streptomyces caniscabiei]
MKQLLELFGFLALLQGTGGLVYELTGKLKWGVTQRWSTLDGYEIYVSIALIVLAIALFAAAESRRSG